MARCTWRNEFRFFSSVLTPKADSPTGRTETFASHRRLPSSMFPSLTPTATSTSRTRLNASAASAADRRSGSVTISMSGTPLRLKSRWVERAESAKPSCRDLPASSSMCTRVMPTVTTRPSDAKAIGAARRERTVVLRDLVALGQVGIEVVLPREDRLGMDPAAQRQGGARGELDGAAVQDRQRAGKAETDRDRARCWARRRTGWSSRRRSSWRSAAARESRGR